jgi:hypothetical protein
MSRNFIQSEEIAQILPAMAAHDRVADTPLFGGVQLSETIRDAGCDEFAAATDSVQEVVQNLPDPQPNIWSEKWNI